MSYGLGAISSVSRIGLGADLSLSDAQDKFWANFSKELTAQNDTVAANFGKGASDGAIKSIYDSGYVITTDSGTLSQDKVRGLIDQKFPADQTAARKAAFVSAVDDMKYQGFGVKQIDPGQALMPTQSGVPIPGAPISPEYSGVAAVQDAGTPGVGKTPVTITTMNSALNLVSAYAPLFGPAQKQLTAKQILAQAKKGKQFYAPPETNYTPYILAAGAVVLIGGVLYFALRKGK